MNPLDRDDDRPPSTPRVRACPTGCVQIASGEPNRGTYGQNSPRPNSTQRGGEHEQGEDHRDHDADRAGDAERAVAREFGEQQGQQGERDGAAARDDRGTGAAQGAPHRVASILVQPQLVPVARDEQQGVVGSGTEDEHRQDAGHRRIQGDADCGRHAAGDDARERVGEADDDERARATATGCGR